MNFILYMALLRRNLKVSCYLGRSHHFSHPWKNSPPFQCFQWKRVVPERFSAISAQYYSWNWSVRWSHYLWKLELLKEQLMLVNLLTHLALGHPLFFSASKSLFRDSPATYREHAPWFNLRWDFISGVDLLGVSPAEFSFDTNRIPYIRYLVYNLTMPSFRRKFCLFPKDKKFSLSFWKLISYCFLPAHIEHSYSPVIFLESTFALLRLCLFLILRLNPNFRRSFFFLAP